MVSVNVFRLSRLLLLAILPAFILAQDYITVDTQEGTVRGQLSQTYTFNAMFKFEGIPYAEPPVGDLRFQPPVPKAAWRGVRDALAVGCECLQDTRGAATGAQDCLYLNVYGPGTSSQNGTLKPVMVNIHSGCFERGSGATGVEADFYVDHGIIFVSFNYRLGILGFLSTNDEVVPGNMGLKDQVEALRWVQRNIAAFGGDPQRVTIFGDCGGGASVHYHVLSPKSKGLFKNAIATSGTALSLLSFTRNATDRAIKYAKTLGYTGKSSSDLVDFLMSVDPDTLVANSTEVSEEDKKALVFCKWLPSAEPEHDDAFLTGEPWTLVAQRPHSPVPDVASVIDLELREQIRLIRYLVLGSAFERIKKNGRYLVNLRVK